MQVHPDDAYAAAHENGSLENYLVKYPVARGDVIDIPAGTIHAIGGGCTILEVQQNSGLTGLPFQNEFFAVEMDGNTIRVYAK